MLIYYYSFETFIRAILFANDMLLSFNSCECNKSSYRVSQWELSLLTTFFSFILLLKKYFLLRSSRTHDGNLTLSLYFKVLFDSIHNLSYQFL